MKIGGGPAKRLVTPRLIAELGDPLKGFINPILRHRFICCPINCRPQLHNVSGWAQNYCCRR